MIQHTLVIIKNDAIERGLVGEIISRFESAGMQIRTMVFDSFGREKWEWHYAEHAGKPHFESLISHMAYKDVVLLVLRGHDVIFRVRRMLGATNALEALPGTIRGDYGNRTAVIADNLVHASDSPEAAKREIGVWFGGG